MMLSDQEDSEPTPYTGDAAHATEPENISDDADDANGKALAISTN